MPQQALEAFKAILGPLDPRSEQYLREAIQVLKFAPGYAVFREGTFPKSVFLLLAGRVRLSRTAPDGRQVVVSYVEPVSLFGHIAVLGRLSHLTTAAAVAPTECAAIPSSLMLATSAEPTARLGIRLREAAVMGMNKQLRVVNARLLSLSASPEVMEKVGTALGSWKVSSE